MGSGGRGVPRGAGPVARRASCSDVARMCAGAAAGGLLRLRLCRRRRAAAMPAGDPRYLEGADGDLWRRLRGPLPEVRWTPAHLSWLEARARGVGRAVWECSAAAHEAAKAMADARHVAADVRRRIATG